MLGRSLPVKVPFEWCCKCKAFRVSENPTDILFDDCNRPEFTMSIQYGCKYAKFCETVEDARTEHATEAEAKAVEALKAVCGIKEET